MPSLSEQQQQQQQPSAGLGRPKVTVVGALAVDVTMSPSSGSGSPRETTVPGQVELSLGGVGANVARATHSLLRDREPGAVALVAPVGSREADPFARIAASGLEREHMRTDGLVVQQQGAHRTAVCGILLDRERSLVGGVADMDIVSDLRPQDLTRALAIVQPTDVLCFDANVSTAAMSATIDFCTERNIPTFFEPTSNIKALRLIDALTPRRGRDVAYATPNIHEIEAWFEHVRSLEHDDGEALSVIESLGVESGAFRERLARAREMPAWVTHRGLPQMCARLAPYVRTMFVKAGSRGLLVAQRLLGVDSVREWRRASTDSATTATVVAVGPRGDTGFALRHFPAFELAEHDIVGVTGAGDNLAGGILASLARGLNPAVPADLERIVDLAQRAAVATLKSSEAVGDHSPLRSLLPPPARC